jgi:hypothetical protein
MTEPLFLAIVIWTTLLTMECIAAIHAQRFATTNRSLVFLGLLIVAAVFTRYDGWVFGAAVWCVMAWQILRSAGVRRATAVGFGLHGSGCCGPIAWLAWPAPSTTH